MTTARLIQFQCKREGTMFYYQHVAGYARSLICRCPICGSKQIEATGREYKPVDENKRLSKAVSL